MATDPLIKGQTPAERGNARGRSARPIVVGLVLLALAVVVGLLLLRTQRRETAPASSIPAAAAPSAAAQSPPDVGLPQGTVESR